MSAVVLRVSAWVGRQWLRLAVAALVIGVAAGLAMGVVAGARRTGSAPDRYTRAAGGDPDLEITQLGGAPLTKQIAALPGVASAQALVFVPSFLVSPVDGKPLLDPNPFAGDDAALGARVVAGRFTDPANPNELTVNRAMASLLKRRFGTRVGDAFQVVSYSQAQVDANFSTIDKPAVPPFTATVVGITESPMEFDDPSPQMVFSESFLAAHPDVGVVQTSVAVHLDVGAAAVDVLDAVHRMPNGTDAYAAPQRVVSDSARRAVRFQATALWLVAAVTLLAATALIVQVLSRTLRVGVGERQSMLALGWRRRDLAVERAIEGTIIAIIAAPIAVFVAYGLSEVFPLGVLRSLEPHPGARFDVLVTLLGVLGVAVVAVITAMLVGIERKRTTGVRDGVGGLAGSVPTRASRMPLSVGSGFAGSAVVDRRSWASLLAGVAGVAGVVGAVVVGASLVHIVDSPARWGVNYDQLFGNPFTSATTDIVAPIVGSPDVVAVTGANIGSTTINGADTQTMGFDAAKGGLVPTVLHGRAPSNAGEIGLGAEVARRLHVGVGDTVNVAGTSGATSPFAVVGIVVTPDSAGDGAAMTFAAYHQLSPDATENVVLVDFRQDAPPGIAAALAATNFSTPDALVTPTSVRALERVTAAPYLLAVVLGILLVTGGAYLLTTSVRARRRDLAILGALGADRRQLRAVVHWQVSLVAAVVVMVGAPVGIVAGRWVVALLTDALGIVPGADVRVLLVVAIVIVAVLLVNAISLLPARRAARLRIALLSRDR
jgi:ABC-type lipoprotein release transport system permease subunit